MNWVYINLARNKRAVAIGDPLNTETTTTEAPEPPEPTDPPRTSWRRRNRVGGARNSTTGSRVSRRRNRVGGARNSTTGGSRRRSRTNRIRSSGNSTVAGSRASRRNRRKNRRLQQQSTTTEAPWKESSVKNKLEESDIKRSQCGIIKKVVWFCNVIQRCAFGQDHVMV